MKKLFIHTLYLFIFVFILVPTASADVIPSNSHSLNRCVKVVNLEEFPNITLIGYYTGPMVTGYKTYKIENNQCLTKGYKFNTLNIYWNTKNKPSSIDLNKILLKNIEPYGGYIDKKNPLAKENIEYSIAKLTDNKLVLYKSKQISEYNNGTPTKVETFINPLQETQLKNQDQKEVKTKSINKGFWQSIICFLKNLFGKSC